MMSKNQTAKALKNNAEKYGVKNALVSYYLVLMFSLFPLFFTDNYSNIRHDKLYFFLILSGTLIVIECVLLISSALSPYSEKTPCKTKWYKCLSTTDYAFIIFIVFCTVSTLLSSYKAESFTGTQGRNNGLMLLLFYIGIYFMISRLFRFKEYIFVVLSVASCIVYILCILNFYGVDPLSMYAGYGEDIVEKFTSTIGNKNLMSCFCCITLPVLLMFFMHTSNKIARYIYLAGTGFAFCAVLCSDSESGFLGIVPLLALVLLFSIRYTAKIRDFFISLSLILVMSKLLGVLPLILGNDKGFGTIQSLFITNNISYVFIAISILLAVIFAFIHIKYPQIILPKGVQIGYGVLLGAGLLAVIISAVYFTFIDTSTQLNSVMSYLRFNEKWGTHRGYMWIKTIEIFKNSSIKDILFGSGPDTFYSAFMPYFNELNSKFGDVYTDCAHNEYLNYLITIGVTGLLSYIAIIVSVIVRAIKSAKANPLSAVFVSAVVCYAIQSTVNIAQPITTPLFIIFIALTESVCRQVKRNGLNTLNE